MRKFFAAALVCGLGVIASAPAPAIDFFCSCSICRPYASGGGPACRDDHRNMVFTTCQIYYASYCG